jgi:hypothetical protein
LEFSTQILCARREEARQLEHPIPAPFPAQPNFLFFFSLTGSVPERRFHLLHAVGLIHPIFLQIKMAGDDNMDIEVAEKQLKSLDHAEQHYFNR